MSFKEFYKKAWVLSIYLPYYSSSLLDLTSTFLSLFTSAQLQDNVKLHFYPLIGNISIKREIINKGE